ncbi:hypothetical protein CLPUN_03180 [Clostridium puniceum]|uniref:Uncharacterized protein n=1 Tax=Clostridium puniceum TaxID=29367 RepID=A0A1S8TX55_9CLOT|nr:hypothetical protein [Clostridium puniceum]OOM82317.1 hypothetical protein CLPUN_03180 [Clostridium puniceum]
MKFKLKKSLFELLKNNVSEAYEYLQDINEQNEEVNFSVKGEDIQEVQLLINDEIVLRGMDKQDTVNDLGLKLYKLYDEILYQKNNQ